VRRPYPNKRVWLADTSAWVWSRPPTIRRGARLWVYGELANQGGAHQRSVDHPDLLIAAAAETADIAVLHYDEDYDRIAAITGQPCEWVAPRGSLS
jgi:hypothetical protein